jgi:hypothetical protein
MNVLVQLFGNVSFRATVWLCPIAFTLHALEELPYFTPWVKQHINPYFTQTHYLKVHLLGIAGLACADLIVWSFPTRPLVILFFTLMITPGLLCNVFFHAGTSIAYRSYSPGLVTGLFVYLPLYALICKLAFSSGLMTEGWWVFSTIFAACFHALEVRRNVFLFRPQLLYSHEQIR